MLFKNGTRGERLMIRFNTHPAGGAPGVRYHDPTTNGVRSTAIANHLIPSQQHSDYPVLRSSPPTRHGYTLDPLGTSFTASG